MNLDRQMFAACIRARRAELGLTQKDVSAESGISTATLTKYEHAESTPSADSILKLALALKVSPNYLFGWDKAA